MAPRTDLQYVQTSCVLNGGPHLHGLMQQCGYTDMGEFINAAMTILAWAVYHKQNGFSVGAINEDKHHFVKLYHPALEMAAAKATAL